MSAACGGSGSVVGISVAATCAICLAACDSEAVGGRRGATGKSLYEVSCGACHGLGGEGRDGVGPPLAGSEWVRGSQQILARIALHGVRGPIEVNGTEYNLEMPALQQTFGDAEVAAILTYIRQAWGNDAPAVLDTTVVAIRSKTADRGDSWTAEELGANE